MAGIYATLMAAQASWLLHMAAAALAWQHVPSCCLSLAWLRRSPILPSAALSLFRSFLLLLQRSLRLALSSSLPTFLTLHPAKHSLLFLSLTRTRASLHTCARALRATRLEKGHGQTGGRRSTLPLPHSSHRATCRRAGTETRRNLQCNNLQKAPKLFSPPSPTTHATTTHHLARTLFSYLFTTHLALNAVTWGLHALSASSYNASPAPLAPRTPFLSTLPRPRHRTAAACSCLFCAAPLYSLRLLLLATQDGRWTASRTFKRWDA